MLSDPHIETTVCFTIQNRKKSVLWNNFFFYVNFLAWFFVSDEQFSREKEQIAHCHSFVKSESPPSLFIKSVRAMSDRSDSLLGIKKRGKAVKNCQKHSKKIELFRLNCLFLRAIHLNHEQITYVALFYRANRSQSLFY